VNFEEYKAQFVYDVKAIMKLEEIPNNKLGESITCPLATGPEECKRVATAGIDDKLLQF